MTRGGTGRRTGARARSPRAAPVPPRPVSSGRGDGSLPSAGSLPPSTASRLVGKPPMCVKEAGMNQEPIVQARRWRAFAVLAVAFFMTIIDLTIVNVALPSIGRDLHFSESNLQWVVTAYGLT